MRLYEIIGNTSDEVCNSIIRIKSALICMSNAHDNKLKHDIINSQLSLLHADKENLLSWVMKDKDIAREYYKIPAQYRT